MPQSAAEHGAAEHAAAETGGSPAYAGYHGGRGSRAQMTSRGSALAMLVLSLAGNLLAGWLHLGSLAGLSFAVGCVLAAVYTQRHDLLLVVTMPPVLFLIAVLCAETLTAPGSSFAASAEAVLAGTFLTLAAAAPWLVAGVVLALAIAMFRGLPQCLRELGADLSGQPGTAGRRGP